MSELRGGDRSRVELLRDLRGGDAAGSAAQTSQNALRPRKTPESGPLAATAATVAMSKVAGSLRAGS